MLAKVLEAHEGKLPDYVKVVFTNTGLEHPKTLDFIERIAKEWCIDIVWLEYAGKATKPRWKLVNHETASRNGEPFTLIIKERQYLPNPVARFCTVELKIRLLDRWAKDTLGAEFRKHDQLIGLRYDEPRRVANIKKNRRRNPSATPMYDARHTLQDVTNFWAKQSFNLDIPMHQGNCQGVLFKVSVQDRPSRTGNPRGFGLVDRAREVDARRGNCKEPHLPKRPPQLRKHLEAIQDATPNVPRLR